MEVPQIEGALARRLVPVAARHIAGGEASGVPAQISVPVRRGAARQAPKAVPLLVGAAVVTAVPEQPAHALRTRAPVGAQVRVGVPSVLWKGRPCLQVGATGLVNVIAAAAAQTTNGSVTVPAEAATSQVPLHGVAAPVELVDPRRGARPPDDAHRHTGPPIWTEQEAGVPVEAAINAAGVADGLPTRVVLGITQVVAFAARGAQEMVAVHGGRQPAALRTVVEGEIPIKVPVIEARKVGAGAAASRVASRQAEVARQQMRLPPSLPRTRAP